MTVAARDVLCERVAEHVANHPNDAAIAEGDRVVTYAQLWRRAGLVADGLAADGVAPGRLVAVSVSRSSELIVAMLGVLRHGCGYVPVDPSFPVARRELILDDAGVATILTADSDAPDELRLERVSSAAAPDGAHRRHGVPDDVAYVIYTSGSTGRPKGVAVGRAHLAALLASATRVFGFGPDDRWTQFHSASFDFSVWEVWGALWNGGTVVVVPAEATIDPDRFLRLVADRHVTVVSQVPTVFGHLMASVPGPALPALRYVIFGGEPVNDRDLERWRWRGLAPQAELVNMYGVTEATIVSTYFRITDCVERWAPGTTAIGRALPHVTVRVVDEELRPVPPGTEGELLLGGASVAEGYLGRPDLSEPVFVTVDGEPVYRTGDVVVAEESGHLHYVRRRDDQVQVRGYRIEPREIEHALRAVPGVSDAAVTVGANALGEPVLVGHVVSRDGTGGERTITALCRSRLRTTLPQHMVPARLLVHAAFPVTPQGKTDRHALAASARTRS